MCPEPFYTIRPVERGKVLVLNQKEMVMVAKWPCTHNYDTSVVNLSL